MVAPICQKNLFRLAALVPFVGKCQVATSCSGHILNSRTGAYFYKLIITDKRNGALRQNGKRLWSAAPSGYRKCGVSRLSEGLSRSIASQNYK